jgi:hypothetical protein
LPLPLPTRKLDVGQDQPGRADQADYVQPSGLPGGRGNDPDRLVGAGYPRIHRRQPEDERPPQPEDDRNAGIHQMFLNRFYAILRKARVF